MCLPHLLPAFQQIMRGWSNYFKHAFAKHTTSSLENFVWRRAIRAPEMEGRPLTPRWP
jgi:Group II intron, maturase-specific domain